MIVRGAFARLPKECSAAPAQHGAGRVEAVHLHKLLSRVVFCPQKALNFECHGAVSAHFQHRLEICWENRVPSAFAICMQYTLYCMHRQMYCRDSRQRRAVDLGKRLHALFFLQVQVGLLR